MKSKKHKYIEELSAISTRIFFISITYDPIGEDHKQARIKKLMDKAADINKTIEKIKADEYAALVEKLPKRKMNWFKDQGYD